MVLFYSIVKFFSPNNVFERPLLFSAWYFSAICYSERVKWHEHIGRLWKRSKIPPEKPYIPLTVTCTVNKMNVFKLIFKFTRTRRRKDGFPGQLIVLYSGHWSTNSCILPGSYLTCLMMYFIDKGSLVAERRIIRRVKFQWLYFLNCWATITCHRVISYTLPRLSSVGH